MTEESYNVVITVKAAALPRLIAEGKIVEVDGEYRWPDGDGYHRVNVVEET